MIDTLYLNDLSLRELSTKSHIEILFDRLRKIVSIFDLETLPNLNFIVDVFSPYSEEQKVGFIDLISQVDSSMSDYLFSQLQSSYYTDPPTEAPLCTFNSHDISLVATFLNYENKDAILFSFPTNKDWDQTQLNFEFGEAGNISFNHIGDINEDTDWIKDKLTQKFSYRDADEFIEKFLPRFSNLQFNQSSIGQLKKIDTDVAKLERLERCFTILNNYCTQDWVSSFRLDKINEQGVRLRGESESTRVNEAYMNERKFKDLVGNSVQFELHFDITKAERCYVLPLHTKKKILIGYIGDHLSTTKHN